MTKANNPLATWRLDPAAISYVGEGLVRPESVLAAESGRLFVSDGRGGFSWIDQDGKQGFVPQRRNDKPQENEPNGLAITADGAVLIANFGTGALERVDLDGNVITLLESLDGEPLGKVNFVLPDSRGRLWISVSTRHDQFIEAFRPDVADGYVICLNGTDARIVADGLFFPNEMRFDTEERHLFVAETTGRRVIRFDVVEGGSLSAPRTYGPSALGAGFPDGMMFDSYGNLWIAMVMADRLIAITPNEEVITILDDSDATTCAALDGLFANGALSFEDMIGCKGTIAPWISSICFGGPDRKTVYLGSLLGDRLASFRSPVAGTSPLEARIWQLGAETHRSLL